ncbi:MAG TPA: nucleotide sugar dehydrogenase [Myxococcales bacterium]|nr:nucleotide sugar dehydrogenase [Myxococcales bacterium]HIM00587.1 nucleotide sugar dehydrogenase [Myxococcales bacterium]
MSRLTELADRIDSREARIGVIGLGYVGLPLAVEFAKIGFDVTGFDIDANKINAIEKGESYIEDVPNADLNEVKAAGRLHATADFGDLTRLDIINICVPTPLTRTKDPDVSHMARAVEEIRRRLRTGQLIILGSTTYPGTTQELFVPMLEESGLEVGEDFSLAFAPERIDPGNKLFTVRNVPKVVGGQTPLCTELASKIFGTIFDEIVPVSSTQSAEMVKLLENTFRAINIGLANEIALMCQRLDLDVWEVIEAAATKPYGFMKFLPGPGLGGHCIPVDPSYLSWKMKSLNFPARFIDLATDINSRMPEHVCERVADLLNQDRKSVNGAKILILGAAYKSDVGDMRESPALDVIRILAEKGADLTYADPHVASLEVEGVTYKDVGTADKTLAEADLAVILTDHKAFDYKSITNNAKRIFDTRNATKDVTSGREKITKL